jgi:hypothetical protein
MRDLIRRRRAPAAVTQKLDADDLVIAHAETSDGRILSASRRGLWLSNDQDARLVRWEDIVTAVWAEGVLTVTEGLVVAERDGYVVVERRPPWRVTVIGSKRLPPAVRDRVVRSVAVTERHDVQGRGVLIVGRRVGGDADVRWCVVFDEPGDYRRDDLMAGVEMLLERAKARRIA